MMKVRYSFFFVNNNFLLKNTAIPPRWLLIAGMFLLGLLLATGCARVETRTPPPPVIALPPAPVTASPPAAVTPAVIPPTASPTPSPVVENLQPGPTLTCEDSLKFIADLTVPDGAIIARGAVIDKRWQVENNGTCNWDERYRLKILSGAELGLQAEQALYPARSGAIAVLRLMFLAPSKPGVYRSAWQAVSPAGDVFGDIIYIEVRVN